MAMVNMNNLLNGKDSRWLQLEVCREFQRNKCTRPDTECKFAHPPANVEVQNGRVTACYDSIKGRCNREKPPCKYFHPPQHLKDQLLINGRNHLALKNALMQQMGLTPPGQPLIPGQVPAVATNPYLTGMPQVGSTFSPYFTPGPVMPAILGPDPASVGSPLSVVPQTVVTQQKMTRSDRLEPVSVATVGGVEVGKKRARDPSDDILLMDMKSVGSFYYESFAFPGMVPYKRPAADKSGMPVYQPNATTYQQLMQLQQPPFVPVSCEYLTPPATVTSSSLSPATPSCSSVASSGGATVTATAPEIGKVEETAATDKLVPSASKPPPPPLPVMPTPAATPTDPAAAAKEAAQQSYAKAVKMAAAAAAVNVSNPLNINPLVALNYTGVALNKQAQQMTMMPPPPRFTNMGVTPAPQPQPQYQPQANILAYSRAPPPTFVPPFPVIRSQLIPSSPYTVFPQPTQTSVVGNGILNNMVAQYNPLASSTNNNIINSVTLQPYKKMKTT